MQNSALPKGVFTISIDYESGWGRASHGVLSKENECVVRLESEVTRRLLLLFEEFQVPAMWAIVSRLLDSSDPERMRDPLWFDSEGLISQIMHSPVGHEIGSHSWGHVDYGDMHNFSALKQDIEKAKHAHQIHQLSFRSFIFPWNRQGLHEELKKAGIICFRGSTKRWYSFLPGFLKRPARFLDYFFPQCPAVMPSLHASGLVNIPDSMLLLDRGGIRKIIPPSVMIQKAEQGLLQAVRKRRIFHLWFHPSNLSYEMDAQVAILREILKRATQLKGEGKLEILTMSQIATDFLHGIKNNNTQGSY